MNECSLPLTKSNLPMILTIPAPFLLMFPSHCSLSDTLPHPAHTVRWPYIGHLVVFYPISEAGGSTWCSVTTSLLTAATLAHSLSAKSGLCTGNLMPVMLGGGNH